jgi:hypothetical protein
VFRLPARDDPATLTVEQVASALADHDSAPLIDIRINRDKRRLSLTSYSYNLELRNLGTAGALIGTFKADITVPAGSIENVTSQNHVSVETMCEYGDATASARAVQSCGQRRANVIRLSAATIAPNRALRVLLVLNQDLPTNIPVSVAMKTDAGQTFSIQRGVTIDSEGQQCATEFAKQHSLTRE